MRLPLPCSSGGTTGADIWRGVAQNSDAFFFFFLAPGTVILQESKAVIALWCAADIDDTWLAGGWPATYLWTAVLIGNTWYWSSPRDWEPLPPEDILRQEKPGDGAMRQED